MGEMMVNDELRPTTAAETASYIEHQTTALYDLAHRARLDFLAYLIDMARMEAASQASQINRTRVR